jgi:flagellar protein FliL
VTDLSDILDDPPAPSGKKGILFGLLAALVLGAGGFYAAYSGMIGGSEAESGGAATAMADSESMAKDIAYIALDPLVISLGNGASYRYLRFGAQLEVTGTYREEVVILLPRVLDVLNGYLRAVESRDIEDPAAMTRLRAQMLRRVQVVTGDNRVRDILITEFVLN